MAGLVQNHFQFDEEIVLDTVLMGHEELWKIGKEREEIYSKSDFSEEDGMRAGELEVQFGEMGGYEAESEAGSFIGSLGVEEEFHHTLMKYITGNLKVRVLLFLALSGRRDILLLDEPMNGMHL